MKDDEQQKIFTNNLNRLLRDTAKSQKEVADAIGVSTQTFNAWIRGVAIPRMGKIQALADYFGVNKSDLVDPPVPKVSRAVRVPVLGIVPAGIPLEAVEDVLDYEEIPRDWLAGDRQFFALRIRGDSMIPEYRDGDTVIIRVQPDCDSGQDCVVYVNGCDATFKRVFKHRDCIVLQPLNPAYEPMVYDYGTVQLAGVAVEVRRKLI